MTFDELIEDLENDPSANVPATTYTETILQYRVYRHEQLPETHGGKLRKTLVASYDEATDAWDFASELTRKNDVSFYMFSAEDFGKRTDVERQITAL